MRNILFEGYNALDAAIMKGVNASLRAYNWTTGSTKCQEPPTKVGGVSCGS